MDPNKVVEVLNAALALDPTAISDLVHFRVPLNTELLNSDLPLVTDMQGEMGLLGFINGVYMATYSPQRIAAVVDEDNPDTCVVERFVLVNIQ